MSCTTLLLLTFSFEIILLCQNSIRIYQILKLKFKITQTNLDEEMTNIKIVGLNEIYNFIVYNFFHLKSFTLPKFCSKFLYTEVLTNHMNKRSFSF